MSCPAIGGVERPCRAPRSPGAAGRCRRHGLGLLVLLVAPGGVLAGAGAAPGFPGPGQGSPPAPLSRQASGAAEIPLPSGLRWREDPRLGALFRQAGLEAESSEIVRIPTNTVAVDDVDTARKVLDLMERLDDHDDVQSVAANFSIPDEAMAQLG